MKNKGKRKGIKIFCEVGCFAFGDIWILSLMALWKEEIREDAKSDNNLVTAIVATKLNGGKLN